MQTNPITSAPMSNPPPLPPPTSESIAFHKAVGDSERAHAAEEMARVDGQYALRLLVESYGAQTIVSWLWAMAAECGQAIELPSVSNAGDPRR